MRFRASWGVPTPLTHNLEPHRQQRIECSHWQPRDERDALGKAARLGLSFACFIASLTGSGLAGSKLTVPYKRHAVRHHRVLRQHQQLLIRLRDSVVVHSQMKQNGYLERRECHVLRCGTKINCCKIAITLKIPATGRTNGTKLG
jgi:hypothetical protein